MPSIEWRTPAPLWATANGQIKEPQLLKLAGDNFLPDFLGAMAGASNGSGPAGFLGAQEHGFNDPDDLVGDTLKLYHPAHGRYYLVVGSLVCRQLGLPDRTVARQNGERTAFVIRRTVEVDGEDQEQGWVEEGDQRGWQPLVDGRGAPVALRVDEERLPLHPVQANLPRPSNGATPADPFALLAGGQRTLLYGYLPVGNREKYLDRRPATDASPTALIQNFEQAVHDESPLESEYDFRLDDVTNRVLSPWRGLYNDELPPLERLKGDEYEERRNQFSLYLILDLADFLNRYLPEVVAAISGGPALPAGSHRRALLQELQGIEIWVKSPGGATYNEHKALASAIDDLLPYLGLVDGVGEEPEDLYDVRLFTNVNDIDPFVYLAPRPFPGAPGTEGRLHELLREALAETMSPMNPSAQVVELLQEQVVIDRTTDTEAPAETRYFVRLVYEHDPCAPKVSQPSQTFTFARYFDPAAPARNIRIELPSIKPKDLRRYKKGVGMEMAPELRDVMNRIHKGLLEGEDLLPDSISWDLGMICSFSLQIIFLVAFIVMFIFLIALNFIFWWLPFLKICFPIPVKKSSS